MSFDANKAVPVPETTTLISVRPRVRVRTWTTASVVGMNVFTTPWTKGAPVGVYDDSFESLDEVESAAEVDAQKGRWFFDYATGTLRANFYDASLEPPGIIPGPNLRAVVVEWDVFFATRHLNWHRDPMNTGSDDQVWESGLQKPPVPQQGNPDLLFGFSPVRVTDVAIAVGEGSEVMQYLYDWSLNGSRVKIWECAGPLSAANFSEVFTGVAGSYALQGGVLSIEVTDPMNLVNQEIEGDYFDALTFPNLEPKSIGWAIRRVYGCVNGFVPVNIDYGDPAATNNNRDWVASQGQADRPQLVAVIDHLSLDNDNDVSKVDDASGFRVGDSIVVEQGGTPTYEIFVNNVDYDLNLVYHTFIPARVIGPGDEIRRGFIGAINWDNGEGSVWSLAYERDWTEADFANNTKGFVLADNFEANHASGGAPATFDPALHKLYLTVYGSTVTSKKLNGIDPLCPISKNGGALANPVGILWNVLRDDIRTFREVVQLDEEGWEQVASEVTRTVGFALPDTSTADFGTYKELIQLLLQSEFLRLHMLISNGFATLTVTRDKPTTAPADLEASQKELAAPSWSWNYSDTYDRVRLNWDFSEYLASFFYGGSSPSAIRTSRVGRYLHRASQILEIRTLHYENDHAGEVLERLSAIVSERRGLLAGVLPPSYVQSVVGDTVRYSTRFLPGASIDGEISERSLKLARHAKSPVGVTVTLDDQKGIEDFSSNTFDGEEW